MTLRFFRRVRIFPGLRMNLSRSGASLSVGRKGMWYTAGPRGQRATLALPGTGLFWTQRLPARVQHVGHRLARRLEWPIAIALAVGLTFLLAWLQHG
jgi:hypothetical protein